MIVAINNMAAMWSSSVIRGRTSVLLLLTGAAVGIAAYILYRLRNLSDDDGDNTQEVEQTEETPEAENRILVLGLKGAGKTSLLSYMSKQEIVQEPQPTDGFNVMCIHNESKAMNIWEVGGSENIRAYWKNFIQDTNTLVFVVDAADGSRIEEAGRALQNILSEDKLSAVPLIVVANKQDLPDAVKSDNIMEKMKVSSEILKKHSTRVLDTQVPPNGQVTGVEEVKAALVRINEG